jgi:hypothetical protein
MEKKEASMMGSVHPRAALLLHPAIVQKGAQGAAASRTLTSSCAYD